MSAIDKLAQLINSMAKNDKATTAFEGTADVIRIEGDTAWVHIPGGATETPVKLTIDAHPGDKIQVRLKGGRAWITGNLSAPPTDDTAATQAGEAADKAQKTANAASKIAGNTAQYFWHIEHGEDTGAHITEKPKQDFLKKPEGGNLLLRSVGIAIRNGLTELLTLNSGGMVVRSVDGVVISHLGYGDTWAPQGVEQGPYFSFGTRDAGSAGTSIGMYSMVNGKDNSATGYAAHAEGVSSSASGDWSHAEGREARAMAPASHAEGEGTIAAAPDQHVAGKFNVADYAGSSLEGKHAFIIGNGKSDSERHNAFVVSWDGRILMGYDTSLWYDSHLASALEGIGMEPEDYMDDDGSMFDLKKILLEMALLIKDLQEA